MPEEFSKYLGYIDYKLTTYNTSATEGRAARHASLKAALDQRGIPLNADSHVNRSFIVHGQGSLESTVNTAEEKHFLFTHTKYYQRCEDKIAEFRGTNPRWYRRYEYELIVQTKRCEVQMKIMLEHLADARGFILPSH
ncbi:hypothetical protein C6341_g19230 [Phytophthora cactorum]|uniref:Uncharacterized protein n=1 Tax=Phytophthora cactorum TaxID=29920 RepID=A0A8T1BJ12_9STRA|nr:hypothetical protein PC117_g21197 [Phytophthora cactorum]KAG3142954.1 hypothetical protein C6341_g19230 [Phytophthora cactorum]